MDSVLCIFHMMDEDLRLLLFKELENMRKDPRSHKTQMEALRSYIKELDIDTLPRFLALVSESKDLGLSSKECTVSLLEFLAQAHGRKIVPHIDTMMSEIMGIMATSGWSFSLQHACSKAVSSIARFGIDPLAPDDEKKRIITSISKPLSDCLLGTQESIASCAAFCLETLVESDNWQFVPAELVNETCLKVAGALEEKHTQTNSHLGLVVALTKRNPLIVEPYGRSLLKSGLQILTSAANGSCSEKQLQAIQMIKTLMVSIDSRSISSEIGNIVGAMKKFQNDQVPLVRRAAFETLEVAEVIASGSTEVSSSRSQTVDSFDYFRILESPSSIEQSSCSNWCTSVADTRPLNKNFSAFTLRCSDGFRHHTSPSSCNSSAPQEENYWNEQLIETQNVHPEISCKADHESFIPYATTKDTSPILQRPRPISTSYDVKICSSPSKCLQNLKNSSGAVYGIHDGKHSRIVGSPALSWVRRSSETACSDDNFSQSFSCNLRGRRTFGKARQLSDQCHIQEAALMTDEIAAAVGDVVADSARKDLCKVCRRGKKNIQIASTKRGRCAFAVLILVLCLFVMFSAMILSIWWSCDNKVLYVVPT
ncbi:uncharacterized protein LOC109715096 isoform X1 [Ananas comosus]|uniref:Uncharacterized protein LOC109715096 isoform X1 n=2 Tax=Ananas comosus TaxID=4615 RepID=A0A6P5FGS8_ANACO|nr:uncharacterized protein LOC109715096 isoform X1 [Ananas comosus]